MNENNDRPEGSNKPQRRWYHDLFGLTPHDASETAKPSVPGADNGASSVPPVRPQAPGAGNPTSPVAGGGAASETSGETGKPVSQRPYFFEPPPDQPLNPHWFSPRTQMLAPRRVVRVLITPEAYKRMQLYVELASKEVGWLGTITRQDNGDFLIDQTYLLEQEVTPTETELSVEGQNKLVNDLLARGDEGLDQVNRLRFWGHSHVRMQTSPSGTDERTMERWQSEGLPWAVRGIFNKLGRAEFTVYLYEEGYRICDAPWAVYDPAKGKVVLAQPERRLTGGYSPGHGGFGGRPPYENRPWLGHSPAHDALLGDGSAGSSSFSGPKLRVPADLKADDALRNEVTAEFARKVSERRLFNNGWLGFGQKKQSPERDEEWAPGYGYGPEGAFVEPAGDGAPAEVGGRPAGSYQRPGQKREYRWGKYVNEKPAGKGWSFWDWLLGTKYQPQQDLNSGRDSTTDAPDRSDKE